MRLPMTAQQPSGTVTFLFTDIEGSTRLVAELGEDRYARALDDHRRLLRAAFERHGGYEVDYEGDSFFVAFSDAGQAIAAAIEGQSALGAHLWPDEHLIRVRMGAHTGEPLVAPPKYVGLDVHRAARIMSAAHGGQLLISERTRESVVGGRDGAPALRELGLCELKDLPEPERLYQVVIAGLPDTFPPPRVRASAPESAGLPDYSLPPADIPCPYKGLAAFQREDSHLFYGREKLVAQLVERLQETPFIAVVGPSGSGKSSLVRAGLLPALEAREELRCVLLTPGPEPARALREHFPAEGDTEQPVVLVIDQFEEIFTLCHDDEERLLFLDALHAAAARGVQVILALRADFYGHCAFYPVLAALVEQHQALIGPMSAEELRAAIERPAAEAGLVLEPGLVEGMLHDVVGEPGALPLLSHSLVETWKRRSGRTLTLLGYLQAGGVRGALAKTAESVFGDLNPGQRRLARNLFLRLVNVGADVEYTRRRATIDELVPRREHAASLEQLVQVLVDARLVTVGERRTIEVAHEALIRHWPRLQEWLSEDREGRLIHARLAEAAREWETAQRDPSALYRGGRLAATGDWASLHDEELNETERDFLAASRAGERAELEAARRRNRRLRALAAGLALMLAGAVAAGVFALVQRSDAQKKARVALARELGSAAVSEPRIDQAMLLARESTDLDPSRATAGTLLATLLRTPAAVATFTAPIDSRPLRVTVSPDGRTLAVVDNLNTVRLYDTATRRTRRVLENLGFAGAPASYEPSGSALVAIGGAALPEIDILDSRTFKRLHVLHLDRRWLSVRTDCCAPLLLTPDGRTLFFAYGVLNPDNSEGPAYVDRWDLRSGRLVSTTAVGAAGAFSASLIDDARRLVVGGPRAITILDARMLRRVRTVPLSSASPVVTSVIGPDGRTAAFGSATGSVSFVDMVTGQSTQGLGGHSAGVSAMGFSPDGRVLVSAASDGSVIVWNPATTRPVQRLVGHGGPVLGLTFSSDGKTLYTSSLDGAIFEWDLGNERRFGRPFAVVDPPAPPQLGQDAQGAPPLAVSPDGLRFAVRVASSNVAIYSTKTLRRQSEFAVQTGGELIGMAWSRRGQLAVSGDSGHVQLWDVTGRPRRVRLLRGLRSINKQPEAVTTVAFSPDGRRVAAGDVNHTPGVTPYRLGSAAVWDADSGKLLWRVTTRHGWVKAVSFSPDGTTVVAAREDGVVVLYDATSGHRKRALRMQGGGSGEVAAFAPDGILATGNESGIVELWDPATGVRIGHPTVVAAAPVASINFDPSGDTFATTGGSDGAVKLWTAATQQQFGATFPGSPGNQGNAAYTPDGSRVIVIYEDGTGYVWPATVRAWEEHACQVAGRDLTREEWSRFVTGRHYTRVCGS